MKLVACDDSIAFQIYVLIEIHGTNLKDNESGGQQQKAVLTLSCREVEWRRQVCGADCEGGVERNYF